MPRFFFHTVDGEREPDDEGVELPDLGAARLEAIRFGGAVLHDQPELLAHGRDFRVEVADAAGRVHVTLVMRTEGEDTA